MLIKGKEQSLSKRVLWQGAGEVGWQGTGEVGFKPEHKDVQKLLAVVCVGGAAVVLGFEPRALCTPGKPALGAKPPGFG